MAARAASDGLKPLDCFPSMPFGDGVRREPRTVGPDATPARALRLSRGHRVRHFPEVVEASERTGISSERDLRSPVAR